MVAPLKFKECYKHDTEPNGHGNHLRPYAKTPPLTNTPSIYKRDSIRAYFAIEYKLRKEKLF